MKKTMVSAGIILLAAYSCIVGAMYWKQDSMIYFPEREITHTPHTGGAMAVPSEEGTYLDAEAAWDYLVTEYGKTPQDIIVVGHSLGGAVATELAMRKKSAALIVESSFTSLPDLATKLYPWLPVKLISKHQYASVNKVSSIPCPKLFIHSPDDEIIPFEQGRVLYEKASQPKEFLLIKGGHNDGFLISGKTYSDGLMKFFEKYSIVR